MASNNRIPIPWPDRWHWFRRTVLPALVFCFALAALFYVWTGEVEQTHSLGEVEVVRVEVIAGTDGVQVPLPQGQKALFDVVRAGDVIARLDDRPARAALHTLQLESEQLAKELDAAKARLVLEQSRRSHDDQMDAARLAWDTIRVRLDVLDLDATVESERLELQQLTANIETLQGLRPPTLGRRAELDSLRLQRDALTNRIAKNTAALQEFQRQLKEATQQSGRLSGPASPEIDGLLAPLNARLQVQESRMSELRLEIEALQVRAPITGAICRIHCWPGRNVRAGDPVATIAADQGRYIISYVRQEQRIHPTVGMPVAVRVHGAGGRMLPSTVERVGPQYEVIPPRQCRGPDAAEWGLPVRIVIPKTLDIRPGELVDVTFKPHAESANET